MWQIAWIHKIILLGYLGIAIFVGYYAVTFFKRSEEQKYLSAAEKENLLKTKKFIRFMGPLMIILCALGYLGLQYLQRELQVEYIHLLVLMMAYITLGYADILVKERTHKFPPG
jgi:UDP-N-acetylmuramyl pentapeptide phosphotransferase/UDP-N-acetylglucosamine-1-phosphate transferase